MMLLARHVDTDTVTTDDRFRGVRGPTKSADQCWGAATYCSAYMHVCDDGGFVRSSPADREFHLFDI